MTTSAAASPPVAAGLTPAGRTRLLRDLASQTDVLPYDEVHRQLARYAHPSLAPLQRADLFEAHQEFTRNARALRDGVADWEDFYDSTTLAGACGDLNDAAAERLEDAARDAMWRLANGG